MSIEKRDKNFHALKAIFDTDHHLKTADDKLASRHSIEEALKSYVKKSSDFTKAVQQKILYLGEDDVLAKHYAEQSTLLLKEITALGQQILKNPEIKTELESFGNQYDPSELSLRGDFEAIEERLNAQGYLSKEDRPAILRRMKLDARAPTLQQTQSRDGRKY